MNDREAIETIKIAIAEVEWEYPINYSAAFEQAISALEEREERSNGCNICKEMDFVYIWDGDFLLKAGYPSFCPECGRPLKGADNG